MRRPLVFLVFLAILSGGLSCSRTQNAATYPAAPVIVISIDTLRSDRLPAYGYAGGSTPAIDALRKDAILYRRAWSHVPLTLPSHVSILTGELPDEHGVRNNLGYAFDGAKHETLPRLLARSGYATGAAVSAWVLRGATGLRNEFEWYDDAIASRPDTAVGELSRDGRATAASALEWVHARGDKPFFLLLHLFEPHTPYAPPEPFRSKLADPYDGEIAAADAVVGDFLAALRRSGVYDRAIVVLLSDHGEGLGDHGESEHGVFLYREAIQVPLLVKLPRSERAGETIERDVQLIDVMPTVAALTGAKLAQPVSGVDITAGIPASREIHAETLFPQLHFGWSSLRSLVRKDLHFIQAPSAELYDLRSDPEEKTNVIQDRRRDYAAMRAAVDKRATALTAPQAVSREEEEKLASLGYLGSLRPGGEGPLPDPKERIGELETMRHASAEERAGRLDAALVTLRSLVAQNPQFTDAWLRAAAIHERRGDVRAAEESYRRAIEASPTLASGIALSLANLQLRNGKLDDARRHAELALTKPTAAASAHLLLARIALARGDAASAECEAGEAAREAAHRGEAAVIAARALLLRGRAGDAMRILDQEKAAAAQPVLDLDATRADILARAMRPQEAEAAFRSELAAFPRNREAWTRLAVLYVTMSRDADAEEALESMWRIDRSPVTARLAAQTWRAVERPAAAAKWDRRANAR